MNLSTEAFLNETDIRSWDCQTLMDSRFSCCGLKIQFCAKFQVSTTVCRKINRNKLGKKPKSMINKNAIKSFCVKSSKTAMFENLLVLGFYKAVADIETIRLGCGLLYGSWWCPKFFPLGGHFVFNIECNPVLRIL